MLDDAVNAIIQMFSPPLRAVLWKSIGLSIALIVVAAIALHRLIDHLLGAGGASLETMLGPQLEMPVTAIAWLLSLVATLSIMIGSVMLMPAVTAVVGSCFADRIAAEVERKHYPDDPPGKPLPLWLAIWEGGKTALLAVVIYICAAPFVFFLGFGAIVFALATAYILGREYFELAAMRFHPPAQAKALRKRHRDKVYVGGLLITGFILIPIVNLATPLFAMALMVHLHKRVGGAKLIAPQS
jgi:CysZ protein